MTFLLTLLLLLLLLSLLLLLLLLFLLLVVGSGMALRLTAKVTATTTFWFPSLVGCCLLALWHCEEKEEQEIHLDSVVKEQDTPTFSEEIVVNVEFLARAFRAATLAKSYSTPWLDQFGLS